MPAVLAHLVTSTSASLLWLWLFTPFTSVCVGPVLALIQNVTPASMRGLVVAILLFSANIANLVLAPQLIGWALDVLAPHLARPEDSLRWVFLASALTGLWAAGLFLAATRTLEPNLHRAGTARDFEAEV